MTPLQGVLCYVVDRVQEARLQVLMQLLKQREEQHQDLNTKRLDRLWSVALMHARKTCVEFSEYFKVSETDSCEIV